MVEEEREGGIEDVRRTTDQVVQVEHAVKFSKVLVKILLCMYGRYAI